MTSHQLLLGEKFLVGRFAAAEAFAIGRLPQFHVQSGLSAAQSASARIVAVGERYHSLPQVGFTAAHAFLNLYEKIQLERAGNEKL